MTRRTFHHADPVFDATAAAEEFGRREDARAERRAESLFDAQATYRESIPDSHDADPKAVVATRATWRSEMQNELARQYGAAQVPQVLAQAARHVARVSPALFQWLDATGYGDNPAFVRAAIAASRK